jgi:cell division protein FtsN
MPASGSTAIYRVQVGSFKNSDNAVEAYTRLSNAGFSPSYERYQDYYRVIICGVRAADMVYVAQQLGAAGFTEIMIREGN